MFKTSQQKNSYEGSYGGYNKGPSTTANTYSTKSYQNGEQARLYNYEYEMKIDYEVKKVFDFKHYKENLIKVYDIFREDIVNLNSNLRQLYAYYESNFLNVQEITNEVVAQLQRKSEAAITKFTSGVKVPANEADLSDRVIRRLGLAKTRDYIRREIEDLQPEINDFFAEDAYYRRSSYAIGDFYLAFEKVFKLYDILDHRGSLYNFMTVDIGALFNDVLHKDPREVDLTNYLTFNVPFVKERLSESQYYRTSNPGSKERTLFRINEIVKGQPSALAIESVYSVAKNQIIREKRTLIQSFLDIFKRRLPDGLQLPESLLKTRDELSSEIREIREEVLNLEQHNRAFTKIVTGQLNPQFLENMSLEHDSIDVLLDIEKLFFIVSDMTQKMKNYLMKFDEHRTFEAEQLAESIERAADIVKEELSKKYEDWNLQSVVEELFTQVRDIIEKDKAQRQKLDGERRKIQEERKQLYDTVSMENERRAKDYEERRQKQQVDASAFRNEIERKYDFNNRNAETRPASQYQSGRKDFIEEADRKVKEYDTELNQSASKTQGYDRTRGYSGDRRPEPEPSRVDSFKREEARDDFGRRQEPPKREEPKVDAFKREEPKVDPWKREEPKKKEEPKAEPFKSTFDYSKKEEPKYEPPKREEPKTDFWKREEPKYEPPKREEPKTDFWKREEPPKKEEPKDIFKKEEPAKPKFELKKEEPAKPKFELKKEEPESKKKNAVEEVDDLIDMIQNDSSLRDSNMEFGEKKEEKKPEPFKFEAKKEVEKPLTIPKKEEKLPPFGKPNQQQEPEPKQQPKPFTLQKKEENNHFFDEIEDEIEDETEENDEGAYIPTAINKDMGKKTLPPLGGGQKKVEEDLKPKDEKPALAEIKGKNFLFEKKPEEKKPPQEEEEVDEYLDDFDVDSPIKSSAGKNKPEEQKKPDNIKKPVNIADEFEDVLEDIPESKSQVIQQKEYPLLITSKSLGAIDKHVQKLIEAMGLSLDPNEANVLDVLIYLFQDYFSQLKLFIFDYAESDTILELLGEKPKTFKANSVSSDKLEEIADLLVKYHNEIIPSQSTVSASVRFFIPFFADIDPVVPAMVEIDAEKGQINYIYTEKVPNGSDAFLKELNVLIKKIFKLVFQGQDAEKFDSIQGYQAVGVSAKTSNVMKSFEGALYLKLMMLVYYLVYETSKDTRKEPIDFDDNFTNRFLFTLNSLLYIRDVSQSQEWPAYIDAFVKNMSQMNDEQNYFITMSQHEETSDDTSKLEAEIDEIVRDLADRAKKGCKELFCAFDIIQSNFKTVYLVYMNNKLPGKKQFHLVTLSINDTNLDAKVDAICKAAVEKQGFEVKTYRDIPRHNYFYEYVDLTLGAWLSMIAMHQMEAMECLSCLLYSLNGYVLDMGPAEGEEGFDQDQGMMHGGQGEEGDDGYDMEFDNDGDLPMDEIDDDGNF